MSWLLKLFGLQKLSLQKYRKNIDSIDIKILKLLAKRSHIVNDVKKFKTANYSGGLFIKPKRELEMIDKLTSDNNSREIIANQHYSIDFYKHYFRYVISASNQLEQSDFIAIYFEESSIINISFYYGMFCKTKKLNTFLECVKECNNNTVMFIPSNYNITTAENLAMKQKNIKIFAETSLVNQNIANNFIAGVLKNSNE